MIGNVGTDPGLGAAILRAPLTVTPDTPIKPAILAMTGGHREAETPGASTPRTQIHSEARASCIVVVDQSRVVGILTERDVVCLSCQNIPLDQQPIQDVMTQPVITLKESELRDVFAVVKFMQDRKIRHLPILDDQEHLSGLVTHETLRLLTRPIDLLRLRTVADVMTQALFCATPEDIVLRIAEIMADQGISSVVIAEHPRENSPSQAADVRYPVGLLSERDLVQCQALGLNFATTPVVQVMSRPVLTVSPQDSLWTVHELMAQHSIRRLVVTGNQGELLGIVTQSNLLKVFNPWELYQLTALLEDKVKRLEAEKAALSQNYSQTLQQTIEQLVTERTTEITKQAQSESELLRQRLEFLVHHSPALIYSCWPDGDFGTTYVTENCQRILGHAPEDFLNTSNFWLTHIHPDDQAYVLAQQRFAVTTCSSQSLEYRFWHKQGYYIWVRDQLTPIKDPQGNAIELIGAISNITERKNFEEQLRANAIHLRNAQRIGQIGSWEFDIKTEQMAWSQEVFRIFGYDPSGKPPSYTEFLSLIQAADSENFQQALQDSLSQGRPYELECGFYRLNRTKGFFLARGEPVLNHLGEITKLVGTILDISERKRTELALQAKTEELDRFFLLSLDLMGIGSLQGQILRVNQQWEKTFGYTQAELEGHHYSEFIHPEDEENTSAEICKLRQGEAISGFIHRFRAKDGSYRWLEWQAVPSGQQVFAVARDITDAQANQETIKRQLAAIQIAIDGIGILEQEKFTFLNNSQVKMFGYESAEELLGQPWQTLYTPPEILRFELDIFPTLRQKRFWQGEAIGQRKDGSSFDQGLSLALVDDQTMLCVSRDITAQKQTETAIQEQAKRERLLWEITQRIRQSLNLEEIFQSACEDVRRLLGADRVMVFKFDPRANFDLGVVVAESVLPEFVSALHAQIEDHCFGEKYAPLYMQGRYAVMPDIFALDHCHTSILSQFQVKSNMVMPLICGEGLWGLLCVHHCRSRRTWEESEIELTQQIATQLAIAIQQADLFEQVQEELRDRQKTETELTLRNQQLAISNEELQQATRLKDEFLANMSHELRTPLNAILGMAEGLQEKIFGPLSVQQLTAIKTIERSGSHLLELINDILDLAKVESGQLELEKNPTDVAAMCRGSLGFIRQAALKKSLAVDLHIPEDLPELLVDERRMRQVMINLLNNAVKFTPEGGRITIEASLLPPEVIPESPTVTPLLRLAITDTGIGIPEDYRDRLFLPFVQIDSALNRKYMGTGLGLALVKRIVELHGGQVSVTSEVGVGSCFRVDLPYVPLPNTSPPTAPAPSNPSPISPGEAPSQELILLAEDNEANISTISSYLVAKGYRLIFAKNGREAVTLAETERPDLILMDIQMPEMDGLEAMAAIRQLPALRRIPIIALTALAMSGDQERCLGAGASDYLAKPVKLKDLAFKIRQLLAGVSP